MTLFRIKWVPLAAVICFTGVSGAADRAVLAKRLQSAADVSSIDDAALKPWHLKLKFQLFDKKGTPTEEGTIEEWWSAGNYKRIYTSPSYNATEISSKGSLYRTKGQQPAPYLLDSALRAVVHPMIPADTIDNSVLDMQAQTFTKSSLDCVTIAQRGHGYPTPGHDPTFCLDPNTDQLRISWFEPEVSTRSSIALFNGKRVGAAISISIYGNRAVSEHVEELDDKGFDPSIFNQTDDLEDRSDDPIWVCAEAIANTEIRKPMPPSPFVPYGNLGTVVLATTIGKDGHILATDVLASPDRRLSEDAASAVKRWVYRPYMVNGVAIKIRTAIRVHYKPYIPGQNATE